MPSQTMQSMRATVILFGVINLALANPIVEEISDIALLANDICPTLVCGPEHMTVTFLKTDLQKIKVDIDNIHLLDSACKGLQNGNSVSIQSPTKVGRCRTYIIVNDTHAVYKNHIFLKPDPSAVIYRDDFMVNFTCIYPLTMEVSLGTALNPITSTKIIEIIGNGVFKVKMAIFKDPSYKIPREEGDLLSTKDFLYVGVMITEGDKEHFNLVLKNCFATPTKNPQSSLKYYIIKDGCKNYQDKTIQVAANGIASFGQFSVQAFQFIGGYRQIFLHCEVRLCEKSGSCIPDCSGGSSSGGGSENPEDLISFGIGVKEPENLCPNLECGAAYINVTFPRSDLVDSHVDIPKLQTNGWKCHHLYEDEKTVAVGWPLGVGICGTTLTTNNTHANYKNSIYLPPVTSQIIYRTEFYINVSCIYPLDLNVSLHKVLNPLISTITFGIEGYGQFEVIMAAFRDQAFQQPYQAGEITISTKTRLFIGVFISKGDTNEFNLVMQHCYATPTQNPYDPINYGIIVDSCANEEDKTIAIYTNGDSSEGKFSILMFKFVNHNYVHLHCKINLCRKSGACVPICPRTRSRSAASSEGTLNLGPFLIEDTVAPSEIPTDAPITAAPTDAPITAAPIQTTLENRPVPSDAPITAAPTDAPITAASTDAPITAAPTDAPITAAPTDAPITAAPIQTTLENRPGASTTPTKTTSNAGKRTCLDLLAIFSILIVTFIL